MLRPLFGRFFCELMMADEFGLNLRQRRFVDHYLIHGNATQAYLAAGYSENNAGPNGGALLKLSKVQQAIEALTPKPAQTVEDLVTPEQVVAGLLAETRGDNAATRVQAWRELGRALGLFVDRSEAKVQTITYADEIEGLADEIAEAVDNVPRLKVVNN